MGHEAERGDAEPGNDAEAEIELPKTVVPAGTAGAGAEHDQAQHIEPRRTPAIKQPTDQRRRQAGGRHGECVDADDRGPVPVERVAQRQHEHRIGIQQAARDHAEHETDRDREAGMESRVQKPDSSSRHRWCDCAARRARSAAEGRITPAGPPRAGHRRDRSTRSPRPTGQPAVAGDVDRDVSRDGL